MPVGGRLIDMSRLLSVVVVVALVLAAGCADAEDPSAYDPDPLAEDDPSSTATSSRTPRRSSATT